MTSPTPALLGIPYDSSSSFLAGCVDGPTATRRALTCGAGNWATERDADLKPEHGLWRDLGDLEHLPTDPEAAIAEIKRAAEELGADGTPLLSIGGDHAVTWPLIDALAKRHDSITIFHVDAHPDLYDELDGSRFSHACPFARIMEAGLASRLVQVGIRTATAHQHEQIERFGVEMFTAAGWDGVVPQLSGPVYITIDLDGLDPAFAPGVSHHEPGGLTTRQVLNAIHQIADMDDVTLIGADVVELNPVRDHHDMTATVAAKFVKELLGILAE